MPHTKQLIETELSALLEIECEVRDLVEFINREVAASEQRGSQHHPFAPRTMQFVEKVKPHLNELDGVRRTKAA